MQVLTWNVLHRVHAETHGEPVVRRWPNEERRLAAVVDYVTEALTECEAALLQEVSGDLLTALQARFHDWAVLSHLSPRLPRQGAPSGAISDRSEHLVIIAPEGTQLVRSESFENDEGKGFVMGLLPRGIGVVSTHVSWGEKRGPQLAVLARVLEDAPTPMIIGGDFNAARSVVLELLGKQGSVSVLPEGAPPTRPPGDTGGAGDIDHFVVRGGRMTDVEVWPDRELSDHRPVVGTYSSSP